MSDMFERLNRLYNKDHRIDKNGLLKAVEKGLITAEEYKKIVGEDYAG